MPVHGWPTAMPRLQFARQFGKKTVLVGTKMADATSAAATWDAIMNISHAACPILGQPAFHAPARPPRRESCARNYINNAEKSGESFHSPITSC